MPLSSDAEKQLKRLRNQVNWITRISTALSSTKNIDDLISVVLSGVISPTGLGYSRVLFFEHDIARFTLRGRQALFHESKEQIQALGKELEEEAQYLEERSENAEDEYNFDEQYLDSLESSGPWVVLFQRLNPDNEVSKQIRKLRFSTMPSTGRTQLGNIFEEVIRWRKPRALSKAELGSRLPQALSAILPEHFAMVPMFTNKGLRSLLVVDRYLEGDIPISNQEISELSWFARQAALALENAEVNSDLANAYQELKQLDQMKSNFLSVISHELRTPLTAMSGFVDLILEERVGEVNENQRMLMTRVQKNTGHLIHLVNDLIDVAEVEVEGTVELRLDAVEPIGILMDTLPKLEQRRRRKNVRILPKTEINIPPIQAEARSLGRIFFHLLDNAIKFSPDGTVVEVGFRVEDDYVYIDVCDQGVGIAPENIHKIFNQFYQVDNTLTRGHEGLGLGLAVTKMLIQATHGNIDVTSELGEGSTFTVCYPVYRHIEHQHTPFTV